jgi:hypothetical protein
MKTKKHPKRPRDINQLAATISREATTEDSSVISEQPAEQVPEKDPAAVSLGRRGGLKGGKARAAKLTAKQRSEIAKKAAAKRWQR